MPNYCQHVNIVVDQLNTSNVFLCAYLRPLDAVLLYTRKRVVEGASVVHLLV